LPRWNLAESVLVKSFYIICAYNNLMDTVPNWFYFWRQGNVVPGLLSDIQFPQADRPNDYGYTNLDQIYLTRRADSIDFPIGGVNVGPQHFDPDSGMDCTAQTIGHERFHQWIYEQWQPGRWGYWSQAQDLDEDYLPNWFERDSSLTDSLNADTYHIYQTFGWTPPQNGNIGDQEYWACVKGKFNPRGDTLKDWSHGRFSKQWPGP
jgi:hypothetical protein